VGDGQAAEAAGERRYPGAWSARTPRRMERCRPAACSTIRLDTDVLNWFREEVNRAGGGNYQTLMNEVLRQHVEGKRENLEDTLRRVLREELGRQRGPRR
jgi:uncharacterized protein (DUF4415 family)